MHDPTVTIMITGSMLLLLNIIVVFSLAYYDEHVLVWNYQQ